MKSPNRAFIWYSLRYSLGTHLGTHLVLTWVSLALLMQNRQTNQQTNHHKKHVGTHCPQSDPWGTSWGIPARKVTLPCTRKRYFQMFMYASKAFKMMPLGTHLGSPRPPKGSPAANMIAPTQARHSATAPSTLMWRSCDTKVTLTWRTCDIHVAISLLFLCDQLPK